jgi:DNA polymerase-3 subunit alpha
MTADRDKIEKVVRTVAEARAMGITVLAPDVNESQIDFSCVYDVNFEAPKRKPNQPIAVGGKLRDPLNPKIRFGLGAVKGVGTAALESILEVRSAPGDDGKPEPFGDLFDFTSRVDLRRVNKGVIEALVQCGAMDTQHESKQIGRDRALAAIDSAIDIGKKASADRESGQTDLFGMLMGDPGPASGNGKSPLNLGRKFTFPEVPEPWSRNEKLKREKATLGFYISGHPLDTYREELKRFCNGNTSTLSNVPEGTTVTLGGMVEDYRERNTKSGGKMAFFFLDDPFGRIEVIVRQRVVEQFREILGGDQPLLITGNVRADREGGGEDGGEAQPEVKLLLDDAALLVQAFRAKTKAVRVRVHVDRCDKRKLVELRRALEAHPGRCPVRVELFSTEWRVSLGSGKLMVEPSEAMLGSLERLFGEKVCELR